MFGMFYPLRRNKRKQALKLINLLVVKQQFIERLGLKLLIIPIYKYINYSFGFVLTIFLACSSHRGVWCVMSKTGTEHCWPSANLAVQLEKSCWERFNKISVHFWIRNNTKGNDGGMPFDLSIWWRSEPSTLPVHRCYF